MADNTNKETRSDGINISRSYTAPMVGVTDTSSIVSISGDRAGTIIPYSFKYEDKDRCFISISGYYDVLEIILTEYTERHSEALQEYSTVSDSVAMFSYGANPIQITLSGFVVSSPTTDLLVTYLDNYKNTYRAHNVTCSESTVSFTIEGTSFILVITSMNIVNSLHYEGYYSISIEGIGWDYNMSEYPNPFAYGYTSSDKGVTTYKDNRTPEQRKKDEEAAKAKAEAAKKKKDGSPVTKEK